MNTLAIIEILVFFAFFGICFYAVSCIRFDKFCKVNVPAKVQVLMFLISLIMAYLATQCVLSLTIYNGL